MIRELHASSHPLQDGLLPGDQKGNWVSTVRGSGGREFNSLFLDVVSPMKKQRHKMSPSIWGPPSSGTPAPGSFP